MHAKELGGLLTNKDTQLLEFRKIGSISKGLKGPIHRSQNLSNEIDPNRFQSISNPFDFDIKPKKIFEIDIEPSWFDIVKALTITRKAASKTSVFYKT